MKTMVLVQADLSSTIAVRNIGAGYNNRRIFRFACESYLVNVRHGAEDSSRRYLFDEKVERKRKENKRKKK